MKAYLHTKTCMYVHSSFIHKCPKLEKTHSLMWLCKVDIETLQYQSWTSMANILHGKTLKVLPFREGTRQTSHYCHFNTAQNKVRTYKPRFLNKFKIFKGIHPPGKRVLEKSLPIGSEKSGKISRTPKVRNSDINWYWASGSTRTSSRSKYNTTLEGQVLNAGHMGFSEIKLCLIWVQNKKWLNYIGKIHHEQESADIRNSSINSAQILNAKIVWEKTCSKWLKSKEGIEITREKNKL